MKHTLCAALVVVVWPSLPGHAQVRLIDDPVVGRVRFVVTGASFVDATGLSNGANCQLESASAEIHAEDLPERARLVRAVLTIGGSLIGDDGPDFSGSSSSELLATPGLNAEDPSERAAVLDAAIASADRTVELWLPGDASPFALTTGRDATTVDAYHRVAPAFPLGNVAFFTTRFDVTELLQDRESLAGVYTVADFQADLCFGREARCGLGETCGDLSQIHPNAAGSFSLQLIVESPSLPIRSVATFEGLNLLAGTSESFVLQTPEPFSDPAAGRLAVYGLEGDLKISEPNPELTCGSAEFIEVDGDEDTTTNGVCLNDADNPVGNIFNSTINVQPADANITPSCAAPPSIECCEGPGLCGTTGVDIDNFDISPALVPGVDQIRVSVGTGTDLFALAGVVLETDLFEPVLDVDSQVRLVGVNSTGQVQIGAPITIVIAISNTGNIDASGVVVRMSVPPRVSDFEWVTIPTTGVNTTLPQSGLSGTGFIRFDDLRVPAGDIVSIAFRVSTECDALNQTLRAEAAIGTVTQPAFTVASESASVVGPGVGRCEGVDLDGPFSSDNSPPPPPRNLRGGAGCHSLGPISWLLTFALYLLLPTRRKR